MNLKTFIPKEINGWKTFGEDKFYDQKTIFDYIDGSGEVYCSYNFKILLVREFRKTGQPPLIVDFFDMGTSEDAFGVFSHDYENQDLGIGQGSFSLSGSLSFWKGRYFVSIWAEEETEEVKSIIFKLAKSISETIPEKGILPELIKYFPSKNLNSKNIRYFHNHFSLNYHYFLAENNILHLNQNTEAALGEYQLSDSKSFILLIKYSSEEEAKKAVKSFMTNYLPEAENEHTVQIENKKWISFGRVNNKVYILFDFPDKNMATHFSREIENNLKGSA